MTSSEWDAYQCGRQSHRRGEERPQADPEDTLAWAFYLGWVVDRRFAELMEPAPHEGGKSAL